MTAPSAETAEFKPAARTILNGPVVVYYSKYGKYPKFHLEEACLLVRTPPERIEKRTYKDAFALVDDERGRPCRVCALERVFYTVLRPGSLRNHPQVFATFTSQGCPTDPGVNLFRYKWRESTPSGNERLARIARRFKLDTGTAPSGLFTYGLMSIQSAERISRNLRSVIKPEITELPPKAVVECAWALLDDNPPELRAEGFDPDAPDPWEMARLLLS